MGLSHTRTSRIRKAGMRKLREMVKKEDIWKTIF
jgi:hypothetical protein